MKFSYAIDPDRRMIFQRYEGQCSVTEIMASIRVLWADPAYCKTYDGYIDLLRMTAGFSFEDLNVFLSFMRENKEVGTGRYAAITTSPIVTACGMLYQKAMAHHHAFAVFSSPEAARSFLKLEGHVPELQEHFVPSASKAA